MTIRAKFKDSIRSNKALHDRYFMNWDDFTSRIEAKCGVRDTDKVLQILVGIIQRVPSGARNDDFELCTVVNKEKFGLFHRLFYTNSKSYKPGGYLVVWDFGGISQHVKEVEERRWQETEPNQMAYRNKEEKGRTIEVPNYWHEQAYHSVEWGELKQIVKNHPLYEQHTRIGRINFHACDAEDVKIELVDFANPTNIRDSKNPTDLMISGWTPVKIEQNNFLEGAPKFNAKSIR